MPLRTCLGCRRVSEKNGLVRFVSKEGVLALDSYAPGRGAYLCPSEKCVQAVCSKKEAFSRALKTKTAFVGFDELLKLMKSGGAPG